MRTISTQELAVLVAELQELAGFYIDRFYEVSEDRFRLKLTKSKAQANVNIILSRAINKTVYIEKQEQASNFTMAVRKRIEGFQITAIKQLNNDRIVLFEIKKGDVTLNLIFEMFGKGNLIITDATMKILLAYKRQEFKDREIKTNAEYKPPKQTEGYKIEIPKTITPMIFRDASGKAIDYSITIQQKHADAQKQEFKNLSETLDLFYYENPVGVKGENPEQKRLIEELRNSIKKQESLLKNIDTEVQDNKATGDLLLQQMSAINQMIKALQQNKRMTREELQQMFPKIKVLNLDLKDKRVKIEM